jgi:hypothetical protein
MVPSNYPILLLSIEFLSYFETAANDVQDFLRPCEEVGAV